MGEKSERAMLSIGVGDFRNTSAGAYRELVIAFPSCDRLEAPELECASFATCQSQLPDCSRTYMFRSFVSREAALWIERSFGVDAQLAAIFDFNYESDGTIRFEVLGPGGSEIFQGAVKTQVPDDSNANEHSASGEPAQKLSRDGYNLLPYIGIPGVLGPGQAHYACAFSKSVSVVPV